MNWCFGKKGEIKIKTVFIYQKIQKKKSLNNKIMKIYKKHLTDSLIMRYTISLMGYPLKNLYAGRR